MENLNDSAVLNSYAASTVWSLFSPGLGRSHDYFEFIGSWKAVMYELKMMLFGDKEE